MVAFVHTYDHMQQVSDDMQANDINACCGSLTSSLAGWKAAMAPWYIPLQPLAALHLNQAAFWMPCLTQRMSLSTWNPSPIMRLLWLPPSFWDRHACHMISVWPVDQAYLFEVAGRKRHSRSCQCPHRCLFPPRSNLSMNPCEGDRWALPTTLC